MPAQKIIRGNGDTSLGDTGPGVIGTIFFQVSNLGAGTLTPKKRMQGTAIAHAAAAYRNELTQTDVGAGTAITADGIYSIRSDNCDIVLTMASFAAVTTIDYAPLAG